MRCDKKAWQPSQDSVSLAKSFFCLLIYASLLKSLVSLGWSGPELGRAFSGRERMYCLLSWDREEKKICCCWLRTGNVSQSCCPQECISSLRPWNGLSREGVKSPFLEIFVDKDCPWHSVPWSVGMVVFSPRLDSMIAEVFSRLADPVTLGSFLIKGGCAHGTLRAEKAPL